MKTTLFAILLVCFSAQELNPQVDLKEFAEQLVNLTVKEVNELANFLKEEYGIEPASAAVAVAAPGDGDDDNVVEQTEFTVMLISSGGSKLKVVKTVKALTGLGLKEAKAVVDAAPCAVIEKISHGDASAMKKQLEEAGAEVEIK